MIDQIKDICDRQEITDIYIGRWIDGQMGVLIYCSIDRY